MFRVPLRMVRLPQQHSPDGSGRLRLQGRNGYPGSRLLSAHPCMGPEGLMCLMCSQVARNLLPSASQILPLCIQHRRRKEGFVTQDVWKLSSKGAHPQ
jgi:hypothetical protein